VNFDVILEEMNLFRFFCLRLNPPFSVGTPGGIAMATENKNHRHGV